MSKIINLNEPWGDNHKGSEVEAFIKEQLSILYSEIAAFQTTPIIVVDDINNVDEPQPDTVYRTFNGNNYSDYMYFNGTWVQMATYDVSKLNPQISYYECNTTTNTKVVNAANNPSHPHLSAYSLTLGGQFKVKMTTPGTGACTLNVNGTGAKPLLYDGAAVSATNTWCAGEILNVFYDGTSYRAYNSEGDAGKNVKDYLYGDAKLLALGQIYETNEPVKTSDNRLLRTIKDVNLMNLTDKVVIGDLKVYNNNTYCAQKNIKSYDSQTQYSNGDYALGAPVKFSLSIAREQNGGNITVTIGSNIITITTTDEDEVQDIVNKIVQELNAIENVEWAFNAVENAIVATCNENGDNSNVPFFVVGGLGTGVTGTVEVTSVGTDDSEVGADDGTPTVFTMNISLGIGNIDVTIGGMTNTIIINASDKASNIASNIANIALDEWNLFVDPEDTSKVIATAIDLETKIGVVNIAENIFGISGTSTVMFAGSTKICRYDESLDWNEVTLAQYAADCGENAMWSSALDINTLINYLVEQNNINKEIADIKDKLKKDEYVLAIQAVKQEEKNKKYENKLEGKTLTDVEYIVARAVGEHERRINNIEENGGGGGDSGNSSLNGVVKANNSDTICVIGSSFGIGYTVSGKHWVNIVSMFSDYSVQNLSADGSSNLTRLQALRNGNITPAAKAKYALLVNSENLGGGQTVLLRSFVNLAKVIMSYGITPICGTSYRPADGARQMHFYFCSLLRNWCKQNNTIFMDAAQYRLIVGEGYNFEKPGNTHLGTRQIPLVAYAYMDALSGLERPFQSLKTFTKRNEVFINDLDDLVFSDNYGRARVFKEATSYKDYALISAILPATTKNLNSIKLSFGTTSNVNVYVINTIAKPFPSAPTYTRFHIDTVLTTNPEVNDVYTYGGKQFTVIKVETEEDQHYGAYCDIYCDPPLPSSEEDISGTLTKVLGYGDNEIVFSSYGIATLASGDAAVVNADTIGHWELIEPDEEGGNIYTINNLIARVSIDKINFLVECEGSFSLSNINVAWDATALKTNYQRTPKDDFTTNVWNSNTEIITESTFGTIGTSLSTWKDENGEAIVSEGTYEYTKTGSLYTPGGKAVIKIGPTHYAQMVVSKSSLKVGRIVIEVIARFFGDGITTGFVNGVDTVNSDTFDWAQLTVMVGGGELTYGSATYGNYVYPIGLYWRIIRIPIDILGSERYNMRLRLFADRNGVEVAKVSLKYI